MRQEKYSGSGCVSQLIFSDAISGSGFASGNNHGAPFETAKMGV
jgi:hypothetical protein